MGEVELLVRDLDLMTRYYHEAVTLDVQSAEGDTVVLGRDGVPALKLRRETDLPPLRTGDAGLYHSALLFPDQPALALAVATVATHAPRSFTGSADHLYSEAFYFDDPEGNGVELYRDRPRDQWTHEPGGRIRGATLPLDPNAFLRTHLTDEVIAAPPREGMTLGHIHLQVGNLERARHFYVDTLGFEIKTEVPQALFISAGGYHHHIGMNTWRSNGAGPRAATFGLGIVDITVPGQADLDALSSRLTFAEIPFGFDGQTLLFEDPWKTRLRVRADELS
ncbi:VOC family protein [Mycetocola tolaasinivorans]|uniref:VOC family protein n=2 Tax=Mycetocola tolaasinivorans TaxID=76635 RepID=A0A3L7A6M1_9MICO|nr:VOC family protein [Mycetocola tolaasinivorans]